MLLTTRPDPFPMEDAFLPALIHHASDYIPSGWRLWSVWWRGSHDDKELRDVIAATAQDARDYVVETENLPPMVARFVHVEGGRK